MEITTIVMVVIAFFVFRPSLKKVNKAIENEITVEIAEGNAELFRRVNEAYDELIDTCGEDYKTPEQVYRLMERRKSKKETNHAWVSYV